tara:strand:+ start:469 stop:690 length:222 start_codon:yes stop_codon:yes gene_type:complete
MANEYDRLMLSLGLLDPKVGREVGRTIRMTDTQWREQPTSTADERELNAKTGGAISRKDVADLASIMATRAEA